MIEERRAEALRFLKHTAIDTKYLVTALYGSYSATNKVKYYHKFNEKHGRRFTDEDIEKIIDIKKNLLKELL